MCNIRALNSILARESITLKNKLRQIEKGRKTLQRCEERLKSKAFTRAQERGVVAFDFSAHNKKIFEETQLFERMDKIYLDKRASLQDMPDIFCEWLGDRQVHISDLESGISFFTDFFSQYGTSGSESSKLPLDKVVCSRMLRSSMVIVNSVVELQKMMRHAFLASATLGADVPATAMEILENEDGYFSSLKDQLFSKEYLEVIDFLKEDYEKEELIMELLRLLYPKTWEDYHAEANNASDEREKVKNEGKRWKEDFRSVKIFTRFNNWEITKFMKLSGMGLGKAIEFAKLADRGMFAEDIFMLINLNASGAEREAHASANKFLAINGLCHKDVIFAICSLDGEQLQAFPEIINKYSEWLRLMPEKIGSPDKQEIAAALVFCVEPPKNPNEVFRCLDENEQTILAQIGRMRNEGGGLKKMFFEYKSHMLEVGEGRKKMQKKGFVPPHDELYFSTDLRWFIGEREVSAADVRRILVYGLRLSSRKSTRAGKYMATTAFRDAWRVLKPSERERRIRAEDAELFLRSEGVISFNEDKSLLRLNIKRRGIPVEETTGMGKEILKMTEAWIADLYPPPEEVEMEKEMGKALSDVALTQEEEDEEESRIAALANAFRNAQSVKEKTIAIDALENFGEKAAPFLQEGVNDPDAEVRAFSIECLTDAIGKKATILSIIKLMHDEPVVQEAAARALGDIGGARGVWPLIAKLKTGTEEVRVECAKALGRLDAVAAIESLEKAASTDESENARAEAEVALATIRRRNSLPL